MLDEFLIYAAIMPMWVFFVAIIGCAIDRMRATMKRDFIGAVYLAWAMACSVRGVFHLIERVSVWLS